MGIMLVYDITDEKSFENIKNWIRNIEENASSDVEKMLLGNKCELNEKRQVHEMPIFVFEKGSNEMEGIPNMENHWIPMNTHVNVDLHLFIFIFFNWQVTKERGEKLAVEYGIKFVETSAKASINVEEAFFTLASDIKAKMEKRMVMNYIFGFTFKFH